MYDPSKPYGKSVLKLIQETWETPYVSVSEATYPVIKRKFSSLEVDHTDGIGTKGIYHWRQRTFQGAVLDALAMNLNDLALVRAIPYKLQNHIVIPEDDGEAIVEIMETLTKECKAREIAITGGETSVHEGAEGLDISITMSGFLKEPKKNIFGVGDVLFAFRSNGLHSNGFTKIREVFGKEMREEFVRPTAIYLERILTLARAVDIHGMMHITGGAFTKLKNLLKGADVFISQEGQGKPQAIFQELYKRGVSDEEMYRTFNCGTGFVFSISKDSLADVPLDIEAYKIGEVMSGQGRVEIESLFSDRKVEL